MSSGTQSIADLTTETKPTTGDIPPPLVGASTVISGNKLYLFGGRLVSSRQMTNHLYILNLDTLNWTRHISEPGSPPPPRARYFHSCNLYGPYFVVFGGMSHSIRRSSQSLCALDDICLFDLQTMTWKYPEVQPSIYAPQARYAHLSVCSADKLIVMGGQDMSNQYINEVNVFDLNTSSWIHGSSLSRQYGAYRAIAFSPSDIDTSMISTQPFWEKYHTKEDLPLCVYSNYNFTDVTRDLQSFSPLTTNVEFKDHSMDMTGATLPPGLRFPTGEILGHHLILTGTYLTPTHRAFHVWALNLTNLKWTRIDTGAILSHGSWNRGILYPGKDKFFVFGDRSRDLLEDYNHRQVNFTHVAVVDLEAFGIYTYPKQTCAPVAQELGLSMLNEPSMSDIEIVTEDGRSIPANSNVISLRWSYFSKVLAEKSENPGFKKLLFPENYAVTLAFLQFVYTDHLMTAQQHHPHILSRLLILSDMYNLPRLGELTCHALHQILTISTASMIYEASALTGRTALQVRSLRVMINAKKLLQQQQQQQQHHFNSNASVSEFGGGGGANLTDSPSIVPSTFSTTSSHSSRYSNEEDDIYQSRMMSANTMRRLTASKSSSTATPEPSFVRPVVPSPKLSKSSNLMYQQTSPPLFLERQRKGSLIPPNMMPSAQHGKSSPYGVNMGVPF